MRLTRTAAFAVAASALMVIAGCGSSTKHTVAGLPLWQRVLESGDLPGFDAQLQAPASLTLARFIDQARPAFIRITPASARKELTADGFRLATIATYPGRGKNSPLVASTVIWAANAADAQKIVDWSAQDSVQPCPNVCNARIEEIKVPGIPGARGAHRSRGPGIVGSKPFESYDIVYSDGPFVYDLFYTAPKLGEVTKKDLLKAAKTQYERVKGDPLPRFLVRGSNGGPPTTKP